MDLTNYCAGEPLTVGTEPVLLLDDTTVEDRWGVGRILTPPVRDPRNPVLMPDQPWEDEIAQPSVLWDEQAGHFHMWYVGVNRAAWAHQFPLKDWSPKRHGYPYFVGYARSPDGLEWEKPRLEGRPWGDHPRTNVLMTGRQKAQAVRVTPNPPSTGQPGRFLMTWKDNLEQGNGCLCLAYSDDGTTWREDPENPVLVGLRDTWHNMIFDPRARRWLLYTRPTPTAGVAGVPGGPTEHNYKRRIAVMVGDSPRAWGPARTILGPGETDEPDFDHMLVDRVGSHFIGFLGQMGPAPHMAFTLHLAFSADGLRWQQLPERRPWIPHGEPGSFDAGSTSSAGGVVVAGHKRFVYYRGSQYGQAQGTHHGISGIGRAQFVPERFAAQMGAPTGGFLLTREMIVAASELTLNVTLADGYLTDPATATVPPELAVEILARPDGGGAARPVPGFRLAECTTAAIDLAEHRVTWRDKADLRELVGRPVFIRFYLKNAGIYALRFSTPEV